LRKIFLWPRLSHSMTFKTWKRKVINRGKKLKIGIIRNIKNHLPKWRTGNTLSRIVRAIFERPQIKRILGLTLALVMIFGGTLAPVWGNAVMAQTVQEVITPPQKIITTQSTFQKPVNGVVSQGYHWYHPAVDIADNEGQNVKPVAEGKVIETGYQFFGYGNYVMIDHGQGTISLYAHLSQINVVKDQQVSKNTILGIVGSTGRSTGPHLHLEIWENGDKLDPASFIENL
jgi:murein DD-endopeptidase MepM/ murein hydrolase activator NlpD